MGSLACGKHLLAPYCLACLFLLCLYPALPRSVQSPYLALDGPSMLTPPMLLHTAHGTADVGTLHWLQSALETIIMQWQMGDWFLHHTGQDHLLRFLFHFFPPGHCLCYSLGLDCWHSMAGSLQMTGNLLQSDCIFTAPTHDSMHHGHIDKPLIFHFL